MFRLWGKMIIDNRLKKDIIICDPKSTRSRTKRVFDAIDEICNKFDLGKPIWLDSNILEFKKHARTRFRQDSFMEAIDFDFLEIQVIEEAD